MKNKEKLVELYQKITKKQRHEFHLLYGSLDTISEDKIDPAIKICEQYISKKTMILNSFLVNANIMTPLVGTTVSVVQKPIHCLCGNIPQTGDIFYYKSKYSDVMLEGIVHIIYHSSICSKNGTIYSFDQITIKKKSEIRDEILRKLFGDEN